MATELEIKFAARDPEQLEQILHDPEICGRMEQPEYRSIQMETVYYDTPDGALSARRWTYRKRRENERTVITLKTPAEGYARGEWECEGADLATAPEALIALGAPEALRAVLRGGTLKEVCGARFARRCAMLRLDGARCELACDTGWLLGGGRREALCELELELKDGSAEEMLVFARAIAAKYGLQEGKKSKFARARALAGGL